MKTLAFCRKNGLLMQNHGLAIHSDKFEQICSITKYLYPKIPQNLFTRSAQSAKIFEIFKKKSY